MDYNCIDVNWLGFTLVKDWEHYVVTCMALHRCVISCDGQVRRISKSANRIAAKNTRMASLPCVFLCVL